MTKADDVAKYIILHEKDIDNLKLQKLLYYCQAVNLVLTKTPLFDDKIQAWLYGPVVPNIYHEYKKYGEDAIPKTNINNKLIHLSPEEIENIDVALRFYSKFSGPELIDRTHCETPWISAYKQHPNTEITTKSIYDYFSKALKFSE